MDVRPAAARRSLLARDQCRLPGPRRNRTRAARAARSRPLPRLVLLLLALALVAGCGGAGTSPSATPGIALAVAQVPRASASPADAATAASAIDAFGFDLLRRVAPPGMNTVISPASVAIALAMAGAGARGQTADQVAAVLHGAGSGGGSGINALDQALATRNQTFRDPEGNQLTVALHVANASFAQAGMRIEPAYLDTLASRFGAGVQLVDYRRDPDGARVLINGWVKARTEGRIPQLLAPGVVDTATRLTLVNAVYLKAPWQVPFDPGSTAPAPFTRADGSTVDVPTMSGGGRQLGYAAGPGWQAVELPYAGGSLAMTIVVPDDLAAFERSLDGTQFDRIVGSLEQRQVDLWLPRFSAATNADLVAALSGLGMPLPFDPAAADFSGITTDEPLFISAVVHQANIDVDEKGTEAAAATAVAMAATAMPAEPITLRVDRPFLFAVRDVPTGAVLFLGHVVDPSGGVAGSLHPLGSRVG